jgi:hypothetical protein
MEIIINVILPIIVMGISIIVLIKVNKKQKLEELKYYKIPLVSNGKPTGLYAECYTGDVIYNQLIQTYGTTLPKQIEIIPVNEKEKYESNTKI